MPESSRSRGGGKQLTVASRACTLAKASVLVLYSALGVRDSRCFFNRMAPERAQMGDCLVLRPGSGAVGGGIGCSLLV